MCAKIREDQQLEKSLTTDRQTDRHQWHMYYKLH